MDAASLSERMASAARDLQGGIDAEDILATAVDLAVSNVAGADAAGISFVYAKRRVDTPAATDDMVLRADHLQYELHEGPCLDAIWEVDNVYVPDLRADGRWPAWGPRVTEETGARSSLSLRLFTHADTLGALTLYSRTLDGFDAEDRAEGLAVAAHIATAAASAQKIDHLSVALEARTLIGQAQGIVMERFGVDAPRAFVLLTRLSQNHDLKLREVALRIVENGTDIAREDAG